MSTFTWLHIIAIVTGLVVGGIATWAAQGKGLIAYLLAAVVGALLFLYISMYLLYTVTDPFAGAIVAAIIGSVIFAGLTRFLVVK